MSESPLRPYLLLAISPRREYAAAVEYALDQARESGYALLVLYVLDSDLPEALSNRMSDSGFLSEDATGDIMNAVKAEQYEQGLAFLQEAKRKAGQRNIECEIEIQMGPMERAAPQVARKRGARHVILPRRRRRRWSRLFTASQTEELAAQLPCKVTILDY